MAFLNTPQHFLQASQGQNGNGNSSRQSPPMSPGGADGAEGGKKEIAKMQDELKALALCQTKVQLPMEVVDAEYQWYIHFSFLLMR
ncbi:hypothetical protein B0H14DRAFT_3446442 [Mycena olivaceomarginata]|nr:hypothetical protein B0H14DRAFT_3446442 [Mycena olivaceomarginata]